MEGFLNLMIAALDRKAV